MGTRNANKETLTAEIGQLQAKYTVAVKAYGIIKNTAEREKAKALIASLGKQIDDLNEGPCIAAGFAGGLYPTDKSASP